MPQLSSTTTTLHLLYGCCEISAKNTATYFLNILLADISDQFTMIIQMNNEVSMFREFIIMIEETLKPASQALDI